MPSRDSQSIYNQRKQSKLSSTCVFNKDKFLYLHPAKKKCVTRFSLHSSFETDYKTLLILTERLNKNNKMEEATTTKQQSIENILDEHEEELEQVISDEEPEEDVPELGVSMDKNTNLHFSAAHGMMENIKEDVESKDQRIDAENFMGWTPLMMAVRNGHTQAVKFLLEKGADVTKRNKLGVNIFNISIANGNLELMEIVLRHMLKGGISRNRIQENLSPISLAIIFKKTHLLRFLISQGFDLNATTWKTGLTPLMFAAAVSAEKIIPILEVKGANNKARNYMGVNYHEIQQWRRHGLEIMRAGPPKNPKPKLTLPTISVRTYETDSPNEAKQESRTTIPIVEKPASPIPSKNDKTAGIKDKIVSGPESLQAEAFIPQQVEVPPNPDVLNVEENDFNDENDKNVLNKIEGKLHPPPNATGGYQGGPERHKKEKRFVQPLSKTDSPIIQQSYPYQSPYNGLPCPLYIPILNSPYGAPCPSPVTPLMMPSPFQNFMASIGDMVQNSPMNMVPSQQNHYQCGPPGQPIFFQSPIPRPDLNFAYDSNAVNSNANGYPATPFFYTVYPNMPNVYPLPGSTS